MNIDTISLGTDPEFFIEHKDTSIIPAFFALHGDRDVDLPHGHAYPDGAAIEMTVDYDHSPACLAEKLGNNVRVLQELLGQKLTVRSNGYVAQKYIDELPEAFGKRASLQILGCSKDCRVYPWAEPIKRPDPRTYPYRCIGGHIHIGVGREVTRNEPLVSYIVALCDVLLGTAGTYLADDQESRDRKKLYGKSGTIRIKEYGAIEYRTLPAKALASNYTTAYHMFALAQKAAWFAQAAVQNDESMTALHDLVNGTAHMRSVSTAIDDHEVRLCRTYQMAAAVQFDAVDYSPGFMEHVSALQCVQLPKDFSVEW